VLREPRVIESPNGMIRTGDRQAWGSWVGVGVRVGVDVLVGVEVRVGVRVDVGVGVKVLVEVGVGLNVLVDVGVGVNVLEGVGVQLATAVRVALTGRPVAEGTGAVPVGLVPVWSGCPGPPLAIYGKKIETKDEVSTPVRLSTFSRPGEMALA
jgi:hypothetical protein